MKKSQTNCKTIAAAKAGMSPKTARKYLKNPQINVGSKEPRNYLTRDDHFNEDWSAIEELLKFAPGLQAKTILAWLIDRNPTINIKINI